MYLVESSHVSWRRERILSGRNGYARNQFKSTLRNRKIRSTKKLLGECSVKKVHEEPTCGACLYWVATEEGRLKSPPKGFCGRLKAQEVTFEVAIDDMCVTDMWESARHAVAALS